MPVLTWSGGFLNLVKESDTATVQAAIDAGADLEASTEYGATPLMLAAGYTENAAVVQTLIDAGAEATATNEDGESAWELTQENEALKGTPAYSALNDLHFLGDYY